MSGSTASIVGLGCASPTLSLTQEQTLEIALRLAPPRSDAERRQVEAIYRRAGIERRGAATDGGEAPADPASLVRSHAEEPELGPTTAERMAMHTRRALPLAHQAATRALLDAGAGAGSITHLVTASCTGFAAPGWDTALVERLGLSPDVLRTHIGFMGCHAAINTLHVAGAFASADPAARVLVCCTEICSIHFRRRASQDQVVANALFADGSAAVVVAPSTAGLARIGVASSSILPGSAGQMSWSIGDHGFEMGLGIRLPDTIRAHAGNWTEQWFRRAGTRAGDIRSWAVHPGGPRILDAFADGAALPAGSLDASRHVLASHGNMSSPTVLFVLDHLRAGGTLRHPCAMVSFGPGVTAQGILLT